MNEPHVDQSASPKATWTILGSNRARLRVDGVLHVVLGSDEHAHGAPYAEPDGQEALELVSRLVDGAVEILNMTDIRRIKKTTARVLRLQPHPNTRRLALVTGSPVSRMLGNAYLSICKTEHPTRLFTDEPSALAWLLDGTDD